MSPVAEKRIAPKAKRPLWTCPRCGVKLITRNLWHSCGRATVEDWLARAGPRARRLYRGFERMIGRCGTYYVAPAKTRIAFLARVRFAGITNLSEKGMTCAFAMPRPLRSPRFAKVEEVVPGWWGHWLRITDPDQLDDELQGWLRESYRLMGMQERLRGEVRALATKAGRRARRAGIKPHHVERAIRGVRRRG